ncbi:MAG: hypothetical protein HDT15_02545 [Oscillibacter sp.]|nr:hypothetical protein [Oscillibacter sp.]
MNINTAVTNVYASNATAATLAAQDGIGSEIRDEFLKQAEKLWSEAEAKAKGSVSDSEDGTEDAADIIDQIKDPDSAFYQDMYQRLKLQMEMSDEQKKEQAIIDTLDAILEGMRSSDRSDKRTDTVTSMAGLSKQISELDEEDPRKAQLELFRQQLNHMGIYMDLGEGIYGGTKKNELTLTQQLIREKTEGFDPNAFDLF